MRDAFKELDQDLESDLEKAFTKVAKSLGWTVRKLKWEGVKGAPDRICFGPGGDLLFVELKRGRHGVLSPDQIKEIAMLRAHGQEVRVVTDLADLAEVAKRMKA